MAELTMVEAIRQAMEEEMARDESVFVVGEDVGVRGGVFRATVGLYDKFGEDRVIDSRPSEEGAAIRRRRRRDADPRDPVFRRRHRRRVDRRRRADPDRGIDSAAARR